MQACGDAGQSSGLKSGGLLCPFAWRGNWVQTWAKKWGDIFSIAKNLGRPQAQTISAIVSGHCGRK